MSLFHAFLILLTPTFVLVNALCLHRATKLSFESITKSHKTLKQNSPKIIRYRRSLVMKDKSNSYWFQVNDKVRVISSVKKADVNLRGRVGTVTQTWEKCDVDPTCCCAEFVDDNFAVQVKFEGPLKASDPSKSSENTFIKGVDMFYHYFNEDELVKVL